MKANNFVYQNYLYFTLHQKEYFFLMQNLNRNAAQPGLAHPDIKRIKIAVPSEDVIRQFNAIIDRYNAGGSENEDYYEQLVKLLEEMQKEQERPNAEGLTEEELEVYDLLVRGKKLTQAEEQKVKLAAKNLFKKLTTEKAELLVVAWYKDDQPRLKVKSAIEYALNEDLPLCYDKESFEAKTNLLLNHFVDMAIQGYGWIAA